MINGSLIAKAATPLFVISAVVSAVIMTLAVPDTVRPLPNAPPSKFNVPPEAVAALSTVDPSTALNVPPEIVVIPWTLDPSSALNVPSLTVSVPVMTPSLVTEPSSTPAMTSLIKTLPLKIASAAMSMVP